MASASHIAMPHLLFTDKWKNQYISAISWQSVLLVEEIRVPRENHWPVTNHGQTFSVGLVLTTSVVICTGSCKSNYHTIMTMADPKWTFIFFKGLNITSTWQLLSQFDKFWYNVFEIMTSKLYIIFILKKMVSIQLYSLLE